MRFLTLTPLVVLRGLPWRAFGLIAACLPLAVLLSIPAAQADEGITPERLSEDELAAGEEPMLPMDPLAFYEAKAAAGGELDAELLKMARALTSQHLRWVQYALEQYAVSHAGQGYPQHINQLLMEPGQLALPSFYANPYTSDSIDARDGLELPFGWTPAHPGNFSYLQYYGEDGAVRGYVLLGWGPDAAGGMDFTGDGVPDGVISMLASSMDKFPDGPWIFLSGGREVELGVFAD